MNNENLDIVCNCKLIDGEIVVKTNWLHFFKSLFDKDLKTFSYPFIKEYRIKKFTKEKFNKVMATKELVRLPNVGYEDNYGNKGHIWFDLHRELEWQLFVKNTKNSINKATESFSNTLYIIEIVLIFLLILYPLSEFILWLLSFGFPKIWPDTFSANWITDFADKYLPYAYHPNCGKFGHFMLNFFCFIIGCKLLQGENYLTGGIFGVILLYAFFNNNFFDAIAFISALIGAFIILGIFFAGAGNSSEESSNSVSTSKSKTDASKANERFIGNAVQDSGSVRVYDQNGIFLFSQFGTLHGFTATTLSVRNGNNIQTYDNHGRYKFSSFC